MIQLLVYLRYLAIAGQLLAAAFASQRLGLAIPLRPLVGIPLALLAFNLASHLWVRRRGEGGAWALSLQLVVDLIALTALLYFSGGPANPFVSLYLVPVALAASSLRIGPMAALTVLTAALYTWLLGHHVPLPHVHGGDFELHVTGMWVNFLFSAVIMSVVLGRFMAIVREQRQRLSAARERAMRDESLLALGSLAAGTAHELNTPLTTMGLLLDEWAASEAPPGEEDLAVMRTQLAHCRQHVRALADLARRGAMGETAVEPASSLLGGCVDTWRVLRPGVTVRFDDVSDGARVRVDPGLPQALINLLNNAADANARTGATDVVDVALARSGSRVRISIADRGPGPARDPDERAERRGLGIGLLISNASIERSNGIVRQLRRDGGGCVTEVELPAIEAGA